MMSDKIAKVSTQCAGRTVAAVEWDENDHHARLDVLRVRFTDGSALEVDVDYLEHIKVIGPTESLSPVDAAPPDPRLAPVVGDVLRVSDANGARVTVTAVRNEHLSGWSAVAFYCDPALFIEGRLRRDAELSLPSWRTVTADWFVERLSPRPHSLIGGHGVDLARVLSAAQTLFGDIDRAQSWIRDQPIAAFGHLTAMQLVEQGKAQAVLDYIESISGGASG